VSKVSARTTSPRTVVTYYRKFAGLWKNVPDGICVSVESYQHENAWLADCHVSLPNWSREQWNSVRRFPTRDQAASYAAAFVAEAERIVAGVQRGEEPYMPHRAMAEACAVACDADPGIERAAAEGDRRKLERLRGDFAIAWFRARDFRDFRIDRKAA